MGESSDLDEDETSYGEMTTREAGRRGGEKTKQRGKEFYQKIGSMGGVATRNTKGPDFYRLIGKIGGNKVKENQPPDFYQKIGEKGGAKIKAMLEAGKKALKEKHP
jgi:general stress protein YciG